MTSHPASHYHPGDRVLITEPILGAERQPGTVVKVLKPTRRRPWTQVHVEFDDSRYAIIPGRPVSVTPSELEAA